MILTLMSFNIRQLTSSSIANTPNLFKCTNVSLLVFIYCVFVNTSHLCKHSNFTIYKYPQSR